MRIGRRLTRLAMVSTYSCFLIRGVLFFGLLVGFYIILILYVVPDFREVFDSSFSDGRFFPIWRSFFGLSAGFIIVFFLHVWSLFFFLRLSQLLTSHQRPLPK